MTRGRFRASVLAFGVVSLGFAAAQGGCGSEDESLFHGTNADGGDIDVDQPFLPTVDGPITNPDATGCVNLACNQVTCTGGGTTTITGKVYDPAGQNPLYNALVYIPNAPVQPFDDDAGVTCDQCSGTFASGSPLVAAITDPSGSFTLENVPVDVPLPLVIQVGKWRRVVDLPAATRCTDNPITDVNKTRLPRNSSEGHIPQMAITTGGADPFECLLRKIGLDVSEFTLPSGKGRIHYYKAYAGTNLDDAGGPTPLSPSLWSDPAKLRTYDIVLFPCESTPNNNSKIDGGYAQTDAGYHNVEDYVNSGGRLFATHYSYTWLVNDPPLFSSVANWPINEKDRNDRPGADPILLANVDTSFPKGQAFATWLVDVDASAEAGVLPINDWRHDVSSENKPPSQRWIYADTRTAYADAATADANAAGASVQHFTFNAPIEAGVDDAGAPLQCGKVVFSDFHVSAGERQAGGFPGECKMNPMTPQEKALEFMLFDLSACIQLDDKPPPPPPPPPPK
jgi:hypothetical protein